MKTHIYNEEQLDLLVDLLSQDSLVAFPTETVFGLGANAYSDTACQKIYQAKGRPQDNPFIVHISDRDRLDEVACHIPDIAKKLFEKFSPGPLTIVLPKSPRISLVATAGLATVGVRIPSSPIAQQLLKACPFPIAAPSANQSGRPSPTTVDMVYAEMKGRIKAILSGPDCVMGLESTVIRCTNEAVTLLRPGSISLEELQEFVAQYGYNIQQNPQEKTIQSPGTSHPHYQPGYGITLFSPDQVDAIIQENCDIPHIGMILLHAQVSRTPESWMIKKLGSLEDFARQLYKSLVEFEKLGCQRVFIETPQERGLGRALCDRLARAAARGG